MGVFLNCAWYYLFTFLLLLQRGGGDGRVNPAGNALDAFGTNGGKEDAIILAIMSDRVDGIIVAVSSVVRQAAASSLIHVFLVAPRETRIDVKQKLEGRVASISGLSLADASADLRRQGITPMWEWDSYNVSAQNFGSWRTKNTIHVASWDHLTTHIHPLNHLRFYLPHLTYFRDTRTFFFLDDDVLVQKDLGALLHRYVHTRDEIQKKPILSMCSVWEWSHLCSQFEFLDRKSTILESTVLYGRNVPICRDITSAQIHEENYDEEENCVPQSYFSFLESLPSVAKHSSQLSWNFGVSLFDVEAWLAKEMTRRYEDMLRLNYRLHVFPETSLAFGLGVPYLAFAGEVGCLEDFSFHVLDGLGTVGWPLFEAQSVNEKAAIERLDNAGALHWSGGGKPWDTPRRVDPRFTRSWDREAYSLGVLPEKIAKVYSETVLNDKIKGHEVPRTFLFLTAPRSGSEWAMSLLDQHPYVCASGEADNPDTGFPREALMPNAVAYPRQAHSNINDCAIKKGCTWGFFSHHVWMLSRDDEMQRRRCNETYDPIAEDDPIAMHLPRLCEAVRLLLDRGPSHWIDPEDESDRHAVRRGAGGASILHYIGASGNDFSKRRVRESAFAVELSSKRRNIKSLVSRQFCTHGVLSEPIAPSMTHDALRVCCKASCEICGLAVGQQEEKLGQQDCRRRPGGASHCCIRKILKHGGRPCNLQNTSGDVGCYMRIADMKLVASDQDHQPALVPSIETSSAENAIQYDEWGVAINPATTIQRIFDLYIDSLIRHVKNENRRELEHNIIRSLLPCTCPPGSKVVGFKAMQSWFGHPWVKHSSAWRGAFFNSEVSLKDGQSKDELNMEGQTLNFDSDRFPKVIHFTRWNVLERMVSIDIARKAQVWHARTEEDRQKLDQVKANIPPLNVVESLKRQEHSNSQTKRLLSHWGSEVYQVDYDTCRRNLEECYAGMVKFLGLPPQITVLKEQIVKSLSRGEGDDGILSRLENRDEIEATLKWYGYHRLLGKPQPTPARALDCRRGIIGNATIIPPDSNRAQGSYVCCAKSCGACGVPDRGCIHRPGGADQCCVRNIIGNNLDVLLLDPIVQHPPATRRRGEGRMCRDMDDVGCVMWRYLDNCSKNPCPKFKPQAVEDEGTTRGR